MKRNASIVLTILLIVTVLPTAGVMAQDQEALKHCLSPLGLCDGTGATITIFSVSATCTGIASASGSWTVSGGANGAYFEYYVDGQRVQSEAKSGTGGSWVFRDGPYSLGTHTFEVKIYPMASGTICWSHGSSASRNFSVDPCPPTVSLTCRSIGHPTYECTGWVSGGASPYIPYWKLSNYPWYQRPGGSGPFTEQFVCKTKMQVSFKVWDENGQFSNTATAWCGPIPEP